MNWKQIFIIITLCILFIVIIFIIAKKVFRGFKQYQKMDKELKDKINILILIFFFPAFLFYADYYNFFSELFPQYLNLTREYDWLSFIGTYSASIVSAILLIFITEKDRQENTNVLRESQRPYLDVSYMKIKKDFFDNKDNKITVFIHGNLTSKALVKDEYLTLCIKNNGASVAIIDTNKTEIGISFKLNKETKTEEFKLNFPINRLSIKSGDEIYIQIAKDELYNKGKLLPTSKITKSIIYYKDLFNKKYYDECLLDSDIKVIHDNEEIK